MAKIQLRRGLPSQWTAVNPVLADGEMGVEKTSDGTPYKAKIGDGLTAWNDLDYFAGAITDPGNGTPAVGATPDTASGNEDGSITGNVLTNDTGTSLALTRYSVAGINGFTLPGVSLTIPNIGVLVMQSNGAFSFVPAVNYNGNVPVVTYRVSDGNTFADSTLSLSVIAVNDAPVANDDAASTPQDVQITVAVLANDSDADGDTLTITKVNGTPIAEQGGVTIPNGTVVLTSGSLLFEPTPGYSGLTFFTYTVSDGHGGETIATVSINVTSGSGPASTFNSLYADTLVLNTARDAKVQPTIPDPAKSASILDGGYTDSVFGTKIRRITSVTDVADSVSALRHEYSRRQAWNCDSTRFLAQASNGWWYLYDANTLQRLDGGRTLTPGNGAIVGLAGDCEPIWHPTDPKLLWHTTTNGYGLKFMERNVETKTTTVLFDLAPLLPATGITNAASAWWKGEGRPSNDGRWWALQIEDASFNIRGFVMYDRQTNSIVGSKVLTSNRPDHCSTSPLGNYCVISWYGNAAADLATEQARDITVAGGVRAYTRDFSSFKTLAVLGEHSDLALDPDLNEVFCMISFHGQNDGVTDGSVFVRRIDDPSIVFTTPISAYQGSTGGGIHISGCASKKPGWIIVGKYAGVGAGPFDGQIVAAELIPNGRVLRLAHHQDSVSNYFAEPHASCNNDLTRIVFASDWQGTKSKFEDYEIVLPSYAIPNAGEAAPAALTAPAITGASSAGQTLTRTLGTYSGRPVPTVTGKWQTSTDGGTVWSDLAGQTGATYAIPGGTANGVKYRWTEHAANTGGSVDQTTAVVTVANLSAPVNTVLPVVTPSSGAHTGDTLSTTNGTWTGNPVPAFTYQWQLGGSNVVGATASTYVPTAAGAYTCRVTATNTQGNATVASVAVNVAAAPAEPVPTNVLSFAGKADATLLSTLPPGWSANGANYAVYSNVLKGNGNGYGEGLAITTAAQGTDQAAQITRPASVTDGYAELLLHIHADGAKGGYLCKLQQNNVQLYRDASYIGTVAHGIDLNTQSLTMKITNFAGRVRVYINGTVMHDYTDDTPHTDGAPGINIYSNGNNSRHTISELRYS